MPREKDVRPLAQRRARSSRPVRALGGCAAVLILAACGIAQSAASAWAGASRAADFVRVRGGRFEAGGRPYFFLGANFWQGMNLASQGPGGDRARLQRELDRLASLGVTNLRIVGGSEGPDSEPWRMSPSLQPAPGVYNRDVLGGLDFLVDAIARRRMRAVVVLTNFWPWSGGMAQYVAWSEKKPIPYPPPAAGGDWNAYQAFAARFYSDDKAVAAYRAHIRFLLRRRNPLTRRLYRDEPAIMAWELANEPRGDGNAAAFGRWLRRTAAYVKSLDARHLVTTGCEGETPWPSAAGMDFAADHASPDIDYATIHIWAQNWGWFDPVKPGGLPEAERRVADYFADHAAKAARLGKPLVLEEFGLARDGGAFDPAASVAVRDRYYSDVFKLVHDAERSTSTTVSGANFWAWSGESLPKPPAGDVWNPGDPWTGDPPHERQGWYGVYAGDTSTAKVIGDWARKIEAPDAVRP